MTQRIVTYVSDNQTKYESDPQYLAIKNALKDSRALLGFGDNNGLEQAEAMVDSLKKTLDPNEADCQVNLIAYGRGEMTALIALYLIQVDKDLKDKVRVIVDFQDPDSFALMQGTLRQCSCVKEAYLTLPEKSKFDRMGFPESSFVAAFPMETLVEVETLPGSEDADPAVLSALAHIKTLSILFGSGFELSDSTRDLDQEQLNAYEALLASAKKRTVPVIERQLHQKGKIVANHIASKDLDVINWVHARLLNNKNLSDTVPNHLLFGSDHSHYNYKKNELERACDLSLALDNFLVKSPEQQQFVTDMKTLLGNFFQKTVNAADFRTASRTLLEQANVSDESVIKAVQYASVDSYFTEMLALCQKHQRDGTQFAKDITSLGIALIEEFHLEIGRNKSFAELEKSKAITVGCNTVNLITELSTTPHTLAEGTAKIQQYLKTNLSFGVNWHLGTKIITGLLFCLATTLIGCLVGAALGYGLGLALGVLPEAAGLIAGLTKAVFVGVFLGGWVGSVAGVLSTVKFFKPSNAETQIQKLAENVQTNTAFTP